jgi:hypothetical protein
LWLLAGLASCFADFEGLGSSEAFLSLTAGIAFTACFGADLTKTGFAPEIFFLLATVAICFAGWGLAAFTVGFNAALTGADLALLVSSPGLAGFADAMSVLFRAVHKPLSSTRKGT